MTMMRFVFVLTLVSLIFQNAFAWNDPTEGKPFVPWLWDDQLEPTLVNSADWTGLGIFLSGAAATALAHTQDDKVYQYSLDHEIMSDSAEKFGGFIASGLPGIVLATSQLWWDQPAGLQLGRALLLTSVTHITIAAAVDRTRPAGNRGLSFPSGHTSTAFATATSLAYSYGPWVGVPMYGLATFVGAARISEGVHWLSDVVAGAVIGIYWGRASAVTTKKAQTTMIYPVPIDGGALVNFSMVF
ncbi:MAG: phosphatase PAP2 family protein [Bdellovibrio sp.]|nr:phosphatase PAP2 family protein [Bdellovibrio sp.]